MKNNNNVLRTLTFEAYGVMPQEKELRSIFDSLRAGQNDTNGNYYVIYYDYKTHELYALTVEDVNMMDAKGRTLHENEMEVFCGEKVRGMTFEEEVKWNRDELFALVDIWGNISVDKLPDIDSYL